MITKNKLEKLCQIFLDCSTNHIKKSMTKDEEVKLKFLYGYISASSIGAAKIFSKRIKEKRVLAAWIEFERKMEEILNA